jgi:hypothetical protein
MDFQTVEWWLKEDLGTDAETRWGEYEKAIGCSLGVDRLGTVPPRMPRTPDTRPSLPAVTIHEAARNTLP